MKKDYIFSGQPKIDERIPVPNRDLLLFDLDTLYYAAGKLLLLPCSVFLQESVKMIINAVTLFESGVFDCAFYSARQAAYVAQSLISLSDGKTNLWLREVEEKYAFFNDEKLATASAACLEMKLGIPEIFIIFDETSREADRVVRKQGFDTFLSLHPASGKQYVEEFLRLIYAVVAVIKALYIAVDPSWIVPAGEKRSLRAALQRVDLKIFQRDYGFDIIERVKRMDFYKRYCEDRLRLEKKLRVAYVVKETRFFKMEELDKIHENAFVLDAYEVEMLGLLRLGINATRFYIPEKDEVYLTSYCELKKVEDDFKLLVGNINGVNQSDEGIFRSIVPTGSGQIYMEHFEKLTDDLIARLERAADVSRKLNRFIGL